MNYFDFTISRDPDTSRFKLSPHINKGLDSSDSKVGVVVNHEPSYESGIEAYSKGMKYFQDRGYLPLPRLENLEHERFEFPKCPLCRSGQGQSIRNFSGEGRHQDGTIRTKDAEHHECDVCGFYFWVVTEWNSLP